MTPRLPDPSFLPCRDLLHAWEYVGDRTVAQRTTADGTLEYWRVIACARCTAQRTDVFRIVDGVARPHRRMYAYPDGYTVKGGLSRAEARTALLFPAPEPKPKSKTKSKRLRRVI